MDLTVTYYEDGAVPVKAYGRELLPIAELDRLHQLGWPDALLQALDAVFDYACHVRGLGTLRFRRAEPSGGGRYVRLLHAVNCNDSEARGRFPFDCPSGVEVRLDAIAWVAVNPEG